MSQLPDSLLLAFVRGELAAGEGKLLADAARVTPELRDRIAGMRRRELAADASVAPSKHPIDRTARPLKSRDGGAVLIAANANTNAAEDKPSAASGPYGEANAANVGAGNFRQNAHFGTGRWSQAAMLLLALGAGLIGGRALGPSAGTAIDPTLPESRAVLALHDGQMVAENVLAGFLETSPTGRSIELLHGAPAIATAQETAIATLTFTDRSGRFCREYELNLTGQHLAGIACRSEAMPGNPKWQVTAQVTVEDAGSAAGAAASAVFQPASSGTIEIIEALSARMQAGPALAPEREAALIGNGWSDH